MLLKLYWMLWAVTLFATGFLFVIGYLNSLTLTVLGFIYFALLYGGIISVIPAAVFHGTTNEKH